MTEALRFAIVGCGAIADAHAAAIGAVEGVTLIAATDPLEASRIRAGEAWSCPAFADPRQMLREIEIDAACVCAPPARHRELVETLIDAGVHVLCEKPLAVTTTAAAALAERALAAGRVLMTSSKFRFVEDLDEVRRRIAVGEIGQPILCEVTFCARIPAGGDWKVRPVVSGGGVVMDNGSHVYDVVAASLAEPIVEVAAVFGPRTLSDEVEDTAEILFRTVGGVLGRVALSWSYFTRDLDYLMIQGTEGGMRVAWDGGRVRRHGQVEWTPFGAVAVRSAPGGYNKTRAFRRQIEAFIARIRGSHLEGAAAEGIRAIAFIEAVYRAERSGGRVPLDLPLAHTTSPSGHC